MVRVVLTAPELAEFPELPFTDHYVKLLFHAPGESAATAFDADTEGEELPLVMRTYTVRSFDRAARELTLDFVVHGDTGIAGSWAAAAQHGDPISFRGPGGAWAPPTDVDAVVLVGDEAALPAIAAALERLDPRVQGAVFAEVSGPDHRYPLPSHPHTAVRWVYREQDESLTSVVLRSQLPAGRWAAFVHGNADMVRPVRTHLLKTVGLPRERASISGYWRTGHTEDLWQATKHEFNASLDADL